MYLCNIENHPTNDGIQIRNGRSKVSPLELQLHVKLKKKKKKHNPLLSFDLWKWRNYKKIKLIGGRVEEAESETTFCKYHPFKKKENKKKKKLASRGDRIPLSRLRPSKPTVSIQFWKWATLLSGPFFASRQLIPLSVWLFFSLPFQKFSLKLIYPRD